MTHQLPEPGQRIRLIEMPSDPCPVEAGALGTVSTVLNPDSDRPQIVVAWDNQRCLMLIAGVDTWEVVTKHRVVLIEDNAYARYDLLVEATTPDDAAGIAREMVMNGVESSSGQHFRDEALPYVTDVIDANGEECAVIEEHEFEGVVVPDLLAARNACADAVQMIDDFAVACARNQHTDSGAAWELLNQLRGDLFAVLPKHLQELATQYLADLATTARNEDNLAEDFAQYAMTVSA